MSTSEVEETPQVASPVAGEVRLMTDVPIEMDADSDLRVTPLVRMMRELDERPWLAPVVLLSLIATVLLVRRRR